ncbi:MAG: hypothetical protein E7546_00145 [Ruminococcaceae bacterium]|nr:hypothetical protein [Oscillospiraceae bacterium]
MDNESYSLNNTDRDCLYAKCPYCQNKMIRGRIISGVKKMRWVPYGEEPILGMWSPNTITLGDAGGLTSGATLSTYYCERCNKMVVDLNYYTS